MAPIVQTTARTQSRTNRICTVLPVMFSIIALGLVLGAVAAGVPPQSDEGTLAHLYQLLMAAQFPLVIVFIATAEWTRPRQAMIVLMVQAIAGAAALAALFWSGY